MSTKTSIKRIALVAVSALGFGMVSTVTAHAAEAANASVTALSLTAAGGNSYAVSEAQSWAVSGTAHADYADTDTLTLKFIVSSAPVGSAALSINATAGATTATGATSTDGCAIAATDAVRASLVMTCGAGDGSSATLSALGTVAITPATVGSYTITAWHDVDGDNSINNGEVSTATTVTFSAAGSKTQAALSTTTASDRVTTVAVAATQNSARVGVLTSVTPNFKLTAGAAAGGIAAGDFGVTLSYLLTKPSGSASTLSSSTQTKTTTTVADAGAAESAKEDMTAITFTPDVAGTYTISAWHDFDADSQVDNGEASGSLAIVVAADAPVVTIKAFNSTASSGAFGDDIRGSLVRLTLTNGGVAASLSPSEKITVTVDSGEIDSVSTTTATTSNLSVTTRDLTRDDFDSKGRVWLTFTRATAGTQVITFDGVGGGMDSYLATQSITYKAAAGVVDAWTLSNTTGVKEATALVLGDADGLYDINYLVATGVGAKVSFGAADAIGAVHIKDISGLITGLANAEYSTYLTGASTEAGTATYTAPSFGGEATSVAGTSNYQLSIGATLATNKVTVTARAAVDAAANTVLDQNSAIRATPGSALTLSAVIKNQFLKAMPNVAVSISVTGRNAQVTTLNTVSDANGRVSFTYTDAPLAGVVATTDTVTFNQPNGTDQTVTITWAALAVSKVTLTGGDTTAGVTATTVTNKDISAADGAEAGVVDYTAKVTDANGSILIGVPVTFTISGTGAAVLSTTKTVYTSTSGVATASVYGWLAGTYTVTATAGGVSGTGQITFAQVGTGDERTISATVEGSVVSAKVVDRFGNPVSGVTVYATKTGAGYFGAGITKTNTTTNAAGIAEFVIAGGAATVKVSTISYDAVAGTKGSGQTSSLKGNSDSATVDPTAFTAYTAGTTTVAEEGVGASYDAAGVSSVEVEVNASAASDSVDAANEATDAANAATDAANAAAEAADAATAAAQDAQAAAQDAQAAVAALATSVATLIAGIKAQITTLTNLVIKIQKKVKA